MSECTCGYAEDLYSYVYNDTERDMMSALVAVRVAVEAMTHLAAIADDQEDDGNAMVFATLRDRTIKVREELYDIIEHMGDDDDE